MSANLLLNNPDFELGNTNGWVAIFGPTFTADASAAHDGSYGGLLVGTGAVGSAQGAETASADRIDVIVGKLYNFSLWTKASSALLFVEYRARFYDGGGSLIADIILGSLATTTVWAQGVYRAVGVPVGATKLGFICLFGLGGGNTGYIDTAVVWQGNPSIQGIQSMTGVQSITF